MSRSLNSSVNLGDMPIRARADLVEALTVTKHASANTTYSALIPIAFDTSTGKYKIYDQTDGANGGNEIQGFLDPQTGPQELQTAADHTLAVMTKGEISDFDDISAVVLAELGVAVVDFKADLLASRLREKGIRVKNLSGFNR